MRVTRRAILAAGGISFAVAGCLGDDDDPTDMTPTDDNGDSDEDLSEDETDEDPIVAIRSHPDYGDILVGPRGMTVYNFDIDTQGANESACYDECASNWPPVTVENEPTVAPGVLAEVAVFERDDGTMQVTANGWPLYFFVGDDEPGNTEGQGVNDVWWVLRPDGTPIDGEPEPQEDYDVDATVTVGGNGSFHFEPESVEINNGDTVEFVWEGDGHNIIVSEMPDGAMWDGVSDLQNAGFTHHHTFEVDGRYEYFCEPHEAAGMQGVILVDESTTPDDPEDDESDESEIDDGSGSGYGY